VRGQIAEVRSLMPRPEEKMGEIVAGVASAIELTSAI
jgi:hypothetical protein